MQTQGKYPPMSFMQALRRSDSYVLEKTKSLRHAYPLKQTSKLRLRERMPIGLAASVCTERRRGSLTSQDVSAHQLALNKTPHKIPYSGLAMSRPGKILFETQIEPSENRMIKSKTFI